MGTNTNGDGLRAMNIVQLLMLAAIIGGGSWAARTLIDQRDDIRELKYQMKDSGKNRWSSASQYEYNLQLGTLNATLRTPDVRRIAKEIEQP